MQNVKHLRVLRALLVAFAILFAINISAPVAQAAPVDASQQTVVSTDNSLDNRIKGDPEGGKKDIEMANTYLPVLRWNGLTGNYHSRYSSDAWDRGDAESSGLSTMARSIMQFGDALWSFTATTVNLSSSVDVYGTIGSKIDGVLANIGKAMFNGAAGASSIVAILIGANVIYAFNKSRKTGGYGPLKDLLSKVCVTGFIAFLVFGAAAGGSPSKKVVGGIVSVVDKVGTSVATVADGALSEANKSGTKEKATGCDDYVKTLHKLYKAPTDLEASGSSSVIIDSLSKIWESSAIPVWKNIQFRSVPGPAKEQIDISNTWCHTAESLMQQSALRQAYTFKNSSNYPDTTGRAGWYAFASGVAGGSKNRDQAIMFWTACRNTGSTWKMDPKAKLLLKDSSKGDQACKDFWEGSKKDKNLDPKAKTPAKTVKTAMNDAWSSVLRNARDKADWDVVRGAKSFEDWCSNKRTQKDDGNNLEKEANLQARWAVYFLKNLGVNSVGGSLSNLDMTMSNLRSRTGEKFYTEHDAMADQYANALKSKHSDLNVEETKKNFKNVLNLAYKDDTLGKWHLTGTAQPSFCQLLQLDPSTGGDETASSLTTDNPNGEPFDWAPSDGGALAKLVDKGSAGEGAASFIQSVQSPTWGAGLYGIAVLYLLSSAIIFAIFTAMGVSILIAKAALMLMMLALGLMLIPAIVPGVNTGEKFKKVFITLIGFSGVAAVMMLAVSVVTIISKVMVDVGVGILPSNSSFSVLWAGIAPGATIIGLNMLLKKIGMPSPLSVKGALSWGSNGGSILKGAMAGAAAAKAASAGRSLASRAGGDIREGFRRGRRKAAQEAYERQKGSKNAEPEPLPAKNSQAAWDKKSAVGRGIARAKTGVRNTAMSGYNRFVANTKLGKKVAWANNAFASEWNATKGQRGVFRAGAGVKAWTGSMMASRGGTAAQVRHLSNVASARQSKQTMPTPLKAASPASPTVGEAASSAPVLPSPSSGGGHAPRHSGGSAPSLPNITGGGSSSKPAAPATRYRGSAPSKHPATVTPKHP